MNMGRAFVIITFVILILWALNYLATMRTRRRRELAQLRFSADERAEIADHFSTYAELPEEVQDQLDGLIHVFINEKSFEACGGLEDVTPVMQRVIAAQACLLIVNRPHSMYAELRSILIYPSAFGHEGEVYLGQSWDSGTVVLAWDNVVSGGRNQFDGHNVAFHEFAHQLDQASGSANGQPVLETRGCYHEWTKVFRSTFDSFLGRLEEHKRTVFDEYGAENPAEFFAVATETFFEKPKQLHKKYPELYNVLRAYYNLDPIGWN